MNQMLLVVGLLNVNFFVKSDTAIELKKSTTGP